MSLIQAGDTAQLALLFERHHLALFRYLLHFTRNRAVTEDLVQDVFFRVLKYAATFDSAHSFKTWLYQLARNAHFDAIRKRRPEADPDLLATYRSADPMPEELFSRKQDVRLLQRALASLPEDKRDVLLLSRFHDMRYEDIATLLQCEVGAVKVRVHRALRQLRENFSSLSTERKTL